MNDESVKTLADFRRVRQAYAKTLRDRVKVDKITENANILYKFNRSLPHYVPDLTSNNQKATSRNQMKAELIKQLMDDNFTSQSNTEKVVFELPEQLLEDALRYVKPLKEKLKARPAKVQEIMTFYHNAKLSPMPSREINEPNDQKQAPIKDEDNGRKISEFDALNKTHLNQIAQKLQIPLSEASTKLTKEQLGSAAIHTRNGVADNVADDEIDAFAQVRRFLSFMPRNVWELVPDKDIGDPLDRVEEELATIVPRDRRQPYDMRKLIALVVDNNSFFEMGRKFGPGQIVGFARMNGQSVGIFGNDCRYYAGSMTAAGAQKVRKFVETCETFHIPIIALVDEPGFMIGREAEKAGTIKFGTAAVLAVADSSVPWASVVIKKSYGVAAAAHYGS